MNNKLKELAVEARMITVDGISRYALDTEFEERYALAIINECLGIVDNSGRFLKYDSLAKQIRKHFGIE
jgi:hypothetical protein